MPLSHNFIREVTMRAFHSLRVHGETFNLDARYGNLRYLGGGAYGSVVAADDALTGRRVAVKKCKDVWRHLDDAKRILREIKVLQVRGVGRRGGGGWAGELEA